MRRDGAGGERGDGRRGNGAERWSRAGGGDQERKEGRWEGDGGLHGNWNAPY